MLNNKKIKVLQNMLEAYNNNPWNLYQMDVSITELIEIYNSGGYDEVKSFLRRLEIAGFHREESACKNI